MCIKYKINSNTLWNDIQNYKFKKIQKRFPKPIHKMYFYISWEDATYIIDFDNKDIYDYDWDLID